MTGLRRAMLAIAVFQGLSTLLGAVLLLFKPHYFAFLLDGTAFAGQYLLAALLLGVVVDGTQWAAIWIHVRTPQWLAAGYAVAGFVMLGWILGECLAIGVFIWPHAFWGGVGALQVLLLTAYLGAFRAHPVPA
ncbi:hypothetical protein FRX94_10460 [Corynebacterium canis]|uniref:Integral membrane protein n=1 Tax=Corynebacterium canis TaxID=679663 RepID=A0A5C5UAA0_9CORY|nr:hypothetical protein [Corynebacterium canis]TWT22827.1 hypothetical protein FRX94_10460 [Corynebacterium canis]WJY76236.1 hypothetical protein CCANI_12150 [Corynebacterium canis]